jgi:hypothetical protein
MSPPVSSRIGAAIVSLRQSRETVLVLRGA